MFYTVMKGSILMAKNKLAKQGDQIPAEAFKTAQASLKSLLASGVLAPGQKETGPSLNVERGGLPPIPRELDDKGRQLKSKPGPREAQTAARIKAREAEAKARQDALAENEGEELTLAEAKAHGVVK